MHEVGGSSGEDRRDSRYWSSRVAAGLDFDEEPLPAVEPWEDGRAATGRTRTTRVVSSWPEYRPEEYAAPTANEQRVVRADNRARSGISGPLLVGALLLIAAVAAVSGAVAAQRAIDAPLLLNIPAAATGVPTAAEVSAPADVPSAEPTAPVAAASVVAPAPTAETAPVEPAPPAEAPSAEAPSTEAPAQVEPVAPPAESAPIPQPDGPTGIFYVTTKEVIPRRQPSLYSPSIGDWPQGTALRASGIWARSGDGLTWWELTDAAGLRGWAPAMDMAGT